MKGVKIKILELHRARKVDIVMTTSIEILKQINTWPERGELLTNKLGEEKGKRGRSLLFCLDHIWACARGVSFNKNDVTRRIIETIEIKALVNSSWRREISKQDLQTFSSKLSCLRDKFSTSNTFQFSQELTNFITCLEGAIEKHPQGRLGALPEDIISNSIAKYLRLDDYVRFSRTCKYCNDIFNRNSRRPSLYTSCVAAIEILQCALRCSLRAERIRTARHTPLEIEVGPCYGTRQLHTAPPGSHALVLQKLEEIGSYYEKQPPRGNDRHKDLTRSMLECAQVALDLALDIDVPFHFTEEERHCILKFIEAWVRQYPLDSQFPAQDSSLRKILWRIPELPSLHQEHVNAMQEYVSAMLEDTKPYLTEQQQQWFLYNMLHDLKRHPSSSRNIWNIESMVRAFIQHPNPLISGNVISFLQSEAGPWSNDFQIPEKPDSYDQLLSKELMKFIDKLPLHEMGEASILKRFIIDKDGNIPSIWMDRKFDRKTVEKVLVCMLRESRNHLLPFEISRRIYEYLDKHSILNLLEYNSPKEVLVHCAFIEYFCHCSMRYYLDDLQSFRDMCRGDTPQAHSFDRESWRPYIEDSDVVYDGDALLFIGWLLTNGVFSHLWVPSFRQIRSPAPHVQR